MYHPEVVAWARERAERALGFTFQEASLTEIQDRNREWAALDWTEPMRTIAELPQAAQQWIVSQIQLSKVDFNYWLSRYCMILADDGRMRPLSPWQSQRDFLDILAREEKSQWDPKGPTEIKIGLLMLKARQVGGTAVSQSVINHQTLFYPHTRSLIASDNPDGSLKIWHIFLRMYENLPPWMKPVRDAKVKATNLHLRDLDSDLVVGAGNQKTTLGQGLTIDIAHLTELSSWEPDNCRAIDADLTPAFLSSRRHHSILMLESTAEGARGNWFFEQFSAAQAGKSIFTPFFVAWWRCPDKWAERTTFGGALSGATLELAKRVKSEFGQELSKAQLLWYQKKREYFETRGELATFLQEFPSFPDEAFQTGFRSALPIEIRTSLRHKTKPPEAVLSWNGQTFVPDDTAKVDPTGQLLLWEQPRHGNVYVLGVDVSHNQEGGDSSAIQVLRVGNRWEKDEQVAEFRAKISPMELATPVELLGKLYRDREDGTPAKLAIESNPGSPGTVTQAELVRRGYPHFYIWTKPSKLGSRTRTELGWWTTPGTRPFLMNTGLEALTKGSMQVNSRWLVDELDTFIETVTPGGLKKVEHAPGYHDDRIVALFIAYYVAHETTSIAVAEERARELAERAAPRGRPPTLLERVLAAGPGDEDPLDFLLDI